MVKNTFFKELNFVFILISTILLDLTSFASAGENLYNGIVLPDKWPPDDMDPNCYAPMPVPYLENIPDVIPIDVGRQLFVDDFLIQETTLRRVFHKEGQWPRHGAGHQPNDRGNS